MYLQYLQVSGYRNLKRQKIELSDGINLLVGDNSQGKTNTLEAVYVLATLRSFRSVSVRDLVQYGEKKAEVRGLVVSGGVPVLLKVELSGDGRRLWVGEHAVHSVRDYLGKLVVLAFTPDDLSMVKGSPSVRRQFMERAIYWFHPEHHRKVREFNHALQARNRLLKLRSTNDRRVIDSFSQTLAALGSAISIAREDLVRRIEGRAANILSEIESEPIRLKLIFKAGWQLGGGGETERLLNQLRSSLEEDIRMKRTSIGPQYDDFHVMLGNVPVKKFASQGQQRSIAVAILLAVVSEIVVSRGEEPVILLDDVSSELDALRRKHLFKQVADIGGQVLITTTDWRLVEGLERKTRFEVNKGSILASEDSSALV